MELHVAKAGEKAQREIAKHAPHDHPNAYSNNYAATATAPTATATGIPTTNTTSAPDAPGSPLNYTTDSAGPHNQYL